MSDLWPSSESVQYWSSVCTIVGLPLAGLAVFLALRQLSLGQRAGSAAALVTLHEAIRKCWLDFISAAEDKREFAAAELFNAIEVACAAVCDGIFYGETCRLLDAYLIQSISLIERDDDLRRFIVGHLQDRETFKNIRMFIRRHRQKFRWLRESACLDRPAGEPVGP
ncbi:hypothetical protein [Bradyrhizobium sp. 23]|uniref:hypothetical protein n=1 Tax=Bradyrhizobium sp. 23 TaxID=2782667 RepID=UPI001FFC010B|nr:hypothetical protein [Bradyrhizobium sp. 23]MCK1317155.1 hypothetical protein [Bradyrhizobium sp. 23]